MEENCMNSLPSLHEAIKFELQVYKRPANLQDLKTHHVAFTGSPRKHPYDPYKVMLVVDPFSTNTFYYEFSIEDISFAEDLPNIVSLDNETITMVRIWVKKRSVAIRCTPFWVNDTTGAVMGG